MPALCPPSTAPLTCTPETAPSGALEDPEGVALLRQRVTAEMEGWGADAASEAAALLDDFTLQRYLLARPEGVDAALTMIRESCQWRVSRGISRLYGELHPDAPADCRHRWYSQARSYFYGGIGGTARDGTPYFIERLGKADLAGFSSEPEIFSLMLDAYAAHLELLFRTVRLRSAATGSLVRTILVIDASELSLSTLRHISIIKQASSIGQANFPEGVQRVFVVNAPRVVAAVWGAIAPLLPARTRKKVSINAARQSAAALEEVIAPEELPVFLAGLKPDAECAVAHAERVPKGAGAALLRDGEDECVRGVRVAAT